MTSPDEPGQAEPRKTPRAGYFVAAFLVTALIGAVAFVLGSESGSPTDTSATAGPFAPVYQGLEQRRTEAGVPTMAEGGGEHFHPSLQVYVRGKQIEVPVNIGIDPSQPPEMMAGLHTHDGSGVIHNEAGTGATLGQFFAIWGIPFSPTRLGPYEASGEESVRIWVDGEPSEAFADLELADGQQIVVVYGTGEQVPAGLSDSS